MAPSIAFKSENFQWSRHLTPTFNDVSMQMDIETEIYTIHEM